MASNWKIACITICKGGLSKANYLLIHKRSKIQFKLYWYSFGSEKKVWQIGLPLILMFLRPRPYVSEYFSNRIFFIRIKEGPRPQEERFLEYPGHTKTFSNSETIKINTLAHALFRGDKCTYLPTLMDGKSTFWRQCFRKASFSPAHKREVKQCFQNDPPWRVFPKSFAFCDWKMLWTCGREPKKGEKMCSQKYVKLC